MRYSLRLFVNLSPDFGVVWTGVLRSFAPYPFLWRIHPYVVSLLSSILFLARRERRFSLPRKKKERRERTALFKAKMGKDTRKGWKKITAASALSNPFSRVFSSFFSQRVGNLNEPLILSIAQEIPACFPSFPTAPTDVVNLEFKKPSILTLDKR